MLKTLGSALLVAATFILSATAFASPQMVHLEGSMTSMDGESMPVQLDLKLRKERADQTEYTGTLAYGKKMKAKNMDLELNRKKGQTSAEVMFGFDRLVIDGALLSLTEGSSSTLGFTQYTAQQDECTGGNPGRICYPVPDRVTDEGTIVLKVISAQ
jgi:hypothetical protein